MGCDMTKKKSKKERVNVQKNMNTAPVTEQCKTEEADRAELASPAALSSSAEVRAPHSSAGSASAQGDGVVLSVEHKRQRVYDDVRAQREARRGRDPHPKDRAHCSHDAIGKAAASPAGYVRRSTLYLSVVLALVAGLFVGPLLPGLAGHNISGGQSVGATGAAGQPADSMGAQNDAAIKLAGHILELEEAVRKNPEDTAAWVQLGNLYFDSSKAPQAINAYERALLLKPANANVLTDLGIMYREVGKFEQAIESFRKASLVDQKHQNALFNRGVVLFFDLKRKDEGRKAWQELLVLNPQAKAPDGKPLKDMLRDLK